MNISNLESFLWLIFKVSLGALFLKIGIDKFLFDQKQTRRAKEKIIVREEPEKPPLRDPYGFLESIDFQGNKKADAKVRPPKEDRKRIGDILLDHNFISREILDKALKHQKTYGGSITQYLLHYGYISEEQLAHCLCAQFKVPYLSLASYSISDEAIETIPPDIAERYWVLPVEQQGDVLTVVMIDPLDTKVIDELEKITGLKIVPFVGIISEILSSLESYYKLSLKDKKAKVPGFLVEAQTYVGVERRAAIRYNVPIDIQFPLEKQYIKSQTIDVSRYGFSFYAKQPIPMGTVITLEIKLPPAIHALPIAAVTQVVRCIPRAKQKNFEIGVQTLKIMKKEIDTIIFYAVNYQRMEKEGADS